MKKSIVFLLAISVGAASVQANTAEELRIYLNPGHGSWGPNDRPMATIPYPNLSNGMPDTNGFYESNTNLWKVYECYDELIKRGLKPENVTLSRWKNGPYPYVSGAEDEEMYNRPLSEICEEVELGNYDMFFSHHSNAATEGTSTNYPLALYRGEDGAPQVTGSDVMASIVWDYHATNQIDPTTAYKTSKNLRGDWDFYGSHSISTRSNGNQYDGYLGVLKHGVPGYLLEGYFHTYQPARHRALNQDYCRQEGKRVARGIAAYFGLEASKKGDIMGSVKDIHEHLVNSLYTYNPGTMDQWAPINSATVVLKKDGEQIATYITDTLQNGVFVFEDLEPGDYTIEVIADGYKALGEYTEGTVAQEWVDLTDAARGIITVTANATVYAVPLLEAIGYEPPAVIYYDYPEPELPAYQGAPTKLELVNDGGTTYEIEGTIKRALVRGDSTVVLTDNNGTPGLYLINNDTKQLVKQLSITGIPAAETGNAGFLSRLNDIAFTADGQLVGCNSVVNQFSDAQVDEGFTRGTLKLFKWADFDSDPVEWVTTQNSANFYRCDMGQSLVVSGAANECVITIANTNHGGAGGMRFLKLNIVNDAITATTYTENTISAASNYTKDKVGTAPQLTLSPRANGQVMLDGELGHLLEVKTANTNGVDSELLGTFTQEDSTVMGSAFFKYARHQFMVTPYVAENRVGGIKLYDITDGLEQAQLVQTTNTDVPAAATFMATGATVKDGEIILYLMQDNTITKFTADMDSQPAVKGIYAYGLTSQQNDSEITFNFNVNDNANEAYIVFTDFNTGEEVGRIPVEAVEGANSVTLANDQIPGTHNEDEMLTWGVEVAGDAITNIQRINPSDDQYTRGFVAVDKSPASAHMGTLYAGNRVGASDAANGIYVLDVNGVRTHEAPYTGGRIWGSIYRLNVDEYGYVYIPDWSDGASGVFIADPSDIGGTYTEFFQGTRASSGLITNADGVSVGGSTPCVTVAGTGADKKMYVYSEDVVGPSGNGNGVAVYDIGNEDGSWTTSWDKAPSNYFDIGAYQANTDGNLVVDPDGHGIWVAQTRSKGNNTYGVPCLMFVDNDGNITFNSGEVSWNNNLNGSCGSSFAISNDHKTLAINDGDANIQFFALEWDGNKPLLTPKYSFHCDAAHSNNYVREMAFDYAGNLVCAGANIGIYSIPTDENRHFTPANAAPVEGSMLTTPYLIVWTPTGVDANIANKTIVSERYYDINGIQHNEPVKGVNIIVRTYSDGSTQSVKVLK